MTAREVMDEVYEQAEMTVGQLLRAGEDCFWSFAYVAGDHGSRLVTVLDEDLRSISAGLPGESIEQDLSGGEAERAEQDSGQSALLSHLRQMAARASAVAVVRHGGCLTPGGGNSEAVVVHVEHRDGVAEDRYIPWEYDTNQVHIGKAFTVPGTMSVFGSGQAATEPGTTPDPNA